MHIEIKVFILQIVLQSKHTTAWKTTFWKQKAMLKDIKTIEQHWFYVTNVIVFLLHHQCQESAPSAGSIARDLKKYLFFQVSFHLLDPSIVSPISQDFPSEVPNADVPHPPPPRPKTPGSAPTPPLLKHVSVYGAALLRGWHGSGSLTTVLLLHGFFWSNLLFPL